MSGFAHLGDAFFSSPIAGMNNLSSNFAIPINHQSFLRTIRVDANSTSVIDGVGSVTFLPGQFHIALKLARVWCLNKKALCIQFLK